MLTSSVNTNYINSKFILLIILLVFLLRFYVNYYLNIPLHFDEAQYWDWSQNIDWGYFSKPPLLAWIIRTITILFGNSELSIRIISPLLHSFSAIVISYTVFCITKNTNNAFLGGMIYLLMPGVTFSSLMISTDVPLIFFSTLIALVTIKLYQNKTLSFFYYLILAFILALGFLSKYAILYIVISYLLSIIIVKELRSVFLNKKFLLCIIFVFFFISPHIVWNIHNGFVTFSHTADNANINGFQINIIQGLAFFASQMIIFGVAPFCFILMKLKEFAKLTNIEKLSLINFIVPIIIILTLAIVSRANANWAVIGYPFGCIFLASYLFKKNKNIKKLCLLNQMLFSLLIIFILIKKIPTFPDPFYKLNHVRELSNNIRELLYSTKNPGFLADDREDYAHMIYYLKDVKVIKAKWNGDKIINDHYELTTDINNLKGKNVIFLTRTEPTQAMIDKCDSYLKLKSLIITRKNKKRIFNIFIMYNWK